MRRSLQIYFSLAALSLPVLVASYLAAADKTAKPADAQPVELFAGMNSGDLSVKFIPKNDREGQILIENKTKQPVSVQLPNSFVGVPVLAQIGAGGGTRQRSGGRNGGNNNNQQQTTGGGGGGGFGGGGGGFNIAPESVGKVKVPLVCLEHGKDEPNPRVPYEIRPTSSYTKDGRIEELLTMLGEGNLDQKAAQAAAWHFANNMSWDELNAKKIHHLGGRGDEKYFTAAEMQGAMKIAAESERLAAMHPPKPESDKSTDSASESASYSGKKIYSAETMPDAK
jgi:hypothetical protein